MIFLSSPADGDKSILEGHMKRHVSSIGAVGLIGLGLLVSACGSGSPGPSMVGPAGVTMASLAGTWNATLVAFTPTAGGATVELISSGGSATLVIEANGRYSFTMVEPGGATTVETGSMGFDPDNENFILSRSDDTPGQEDSFFFQQNSADTMVLVGEDTFDFNDDGIDDPASLELDLTRG